MLRARLIPHPQTPGHAVRNVVAELSRAETGSLQVRYLIEGAIKKLKIPARGAPERADGLWQRTCCELFLSEPGVESYQEFNFSPSGAWAAYAFARYRERAADEAVLGPRILLRHNAGTLELVARIRLGADRRLMFGISVVIEETDGALSYWALAHPGERPDFHDRRSFTLELPASHDA